MSMVNRVMNFFISAEVLWGDQMLLYIFNCSQENLVMVPPLQNLSFYSPYHLPHYYSFQTDEPSFHHLLVFHIEFICKTFLSV